MLHDTFRLVKEEGDDIERKAALVLTTGGEGTTERTGTLRSLFWKGSSHAVANRAAESSGLRGTRTVRLGS